MNLTFYCVFQDADGVGFTGQRKLLEYEVTTFNMTPEITAYATGQRVRTLSDQILKTTRQHVSIYCMW